MQFAAAKLVLKSIVLSEVSYAEYSDPGEKGGKNNEVRDMHVILYLCRNKKNGKNLKYNLKESCLWF